MQSACAAFVLASAGYALEKATERRVGWDFFFFFNQLSSATCFAVFSRLLLFFSVFKKPRETQNMVVSPLFTATCSTSGLGLPDETDAWQVLLVTNLRGT